MPTYMYMYMYYASLRLLPKIDLLCKAFFMTKVHFELVS